MGNGNNKLKTLKLTEDEVLRLYFLVRRELDQVKRDRVDAPETDLALKKDQEDLAVLLRILLQCKEL